MAYITVVINTNESIPQITSKLGRAAGNTVEEITQLIKYLEGIQIGNVYGNLQVTIRDTDPSVTTHGTGSVQVTHKIH